ncbi:MAG TPA: tetratricopeptide repeat protein [Vicinamibacterales bacterium]|nr:tetratricopeptide repeat protein [Vicinamibacterales bacterium]
MRRSVLACVLLLTGAGPLFAQTAASSSDPAQAYFEFLIARRLEGQNDAAGALQALKRAIALDPKSAELHAELAGFHARQNQGPEAVAAAEQALTLDANSTEAHRILGLVFAAWSDTAGGQAPAGRSPAQLRARAIEHLSKIVETPAVATDLNIQLTLARLHLRAGSAARAAPLLENIVSQAPYATEPYTLLAEARVTLGNIQAAVEALEAAAKLNPRHYQSLGDLYERQSRWGDAAAAYERAMAASRGPASRDLRLRYVTALINVGDEPSAGKARDVLKDFLMTAPEDARGLFLLSTANLRLGDLAGAEGVARKLMALDPTGIPALHALSAVLVARREYREVIDVLTPLAKDVPGHARGRESDAALLLSQLAHAHTQLGEYQQAIAVLTTAVASDPLNAPALNSLGYTLADRGERLPEAIAYIERALKVEPGNPSYVDSLGWALFKQGRVDEAEPHLRKAADALPDNSVIQDHHGDALARQGKYQEAIAAWERALNGDGEDIDKAVVEKKIRDTRARKP